MNALGGAVGTPAEAGRGSGRLARQSATEYEAKISSRPIRAAGAS